MLARTRLCNLVKFSYQPKDSFIRNISKNSRTTINGERIAITDDGSTVVCWHPARPFPYECSRPIPEEEVKPSTSVLKEEKSKFYEMFQSQDKEIVIAELAKITSTTKHRWYPNSSRFKKTYKRIKSDREWL